MNATPTDESLQVFEHLWLDFQGSMFGHTPEPEVAFIRVVNDEGKSAIVPTSNELCDGVDSAGDESRDEGPIYQEVAIVGFPSVLDALRIDKYPSPAVLGSSQL